MVLGNGLWALGGLLEQEIGLDDFQRALPISALLWWKLHACFWAVSCNQTKIPIFPQSSCRLYIYNISFSLWSALWLSCLFQRGRYLQELQSKQVHISCYICFYFSEIV